MKLCSIDGCPNLRHARGYCSTHANRAAKYGDPLATLPPRTYPTPSESLESRTVITDSGCREWGGSISPSGYGQIRINYKLHQVHRLAWELSNGPIPKGYYVDHLCHNRKCLAVEHLRLATPKQNQEHRLGANPTSVSGVRGVQWQPTRRSYRAYVIHNRKSIYVGSFKVLADAEAAVIAKRIELFTHNEIDRMSA